MGDVQSYYVAVNELLGEIVKEGLSLDEVLRGLIAENSESARAKERAIYEVKLQTAQDRLKRLQSIKPPRKAKAIHKVFKKAFVIGVEARQQEVVGNFFDASAAYELSSREIGRGNSMWDELGVKRYPEL